MSEGALTEAETQLQKVLEIDPENTAARDQRKVLQQERANRERAKHRAALLENAQGLLAKAEYDKCVEALLRRARPISRGDPEILQRLDLARREQQRAKERGDLLKQRVREVERMIDRQALTEAIDLARQTIATVGAEPRLSDILATAERELEFREQKNRDQEQRLRSARVLLDEGRFDEASSAVREALEIHLFADTDPRVANLLAEIYTRKKSGTGSSGVRANARVSGREDSPISTKSDPVSSDAAKNYVFMPRGRSEAAEGSTLGVWGSEHHSCVGNRSGSFFEWGSDSNLGGRARERFRLAGARTRVRQQR